MLLSRLDFDLVSCDDFTSACARGDRGTKVRHRQEPNRDRIGSGENREVNAPAVVCSNVQNAQCIVLCKSGRSIIEWHRGQKQAPEVGAAGPHAVAADDDMLVWPFGTVRSKNENCLLKTMRNTRFSV